MPMTIDAWMPAWDARSRHEIGIAAPPDRVFDAIVHADLGRHPVVRVLMTLRSIPAVVFAPRRAWREWQVNQAAHPGSHGLLQHAFVVLESRRPEALVMGLTGRFWTPTGGLVTTEPARFREPLPGFARAAWSFELVAGGEGTRLSTETRVLCGDPGSRRSFLRYWRVVRIGSGLVRHAVLRQIKNAAERGTTANSRPALD
jgi:hypothetical protein